MRKDWYLLSICLSGIKNIEKEICIDFYKKTIDQNFDPNNYRVKAIYGENGSGKTGIVTAVHIFKELILNNNYLRETSNQVFLKEIVNKKTHLLHLKITFCLKDDDNLHMYQYEFDLTDQNRDWFELIYEKLSYKAVKNKNTKFETIMECRDGELISFRTDEEYYNEFKRVTANLLNTSSFSATIIRNFLKNQINANTFDVIIPVLDLFFIAHHLNVNLGSEDRHIRYLIQESMKEDLDDINSIRRILSLVDVESYSNSTMNNKIPKKDFDEYKSKINQMEQFLRLFKNDIKSLEIDKKEDKDYYVCQLLINYGDFLVDTEFESTGIKKLIRIFDSLQAAASGDIVFIDEMDSNINDVYLCKLVEFMMMYGKGQLCFTTHNTSPMSILKKGKKSIDFLSSDNRIVPWTTNGNYKPDSLYKQGLIQYLPFNIEPEDFIGILGE